MSKKNSVLFITSINELPKTVRGKLKSHQPDNSLPAVSNLCMEKRYAVYCCNETMQRYLYKKFRVTVAVMHFSNAHSDLPPKCVIAIIDTPNGSGMPKILETKMLPSKKSDQMIPIPVTA